MFKYFISSILLFVFVEAVAQEQKTDLEETVKDSIIYTSPYGIRVGVDISKPIKAAVDGSYNSGLEIIGDYRISKRFFVAAEVGYESETSNEDYTNSTAKGSYVRVGVNYNAYENWLDMNNEIFIGFRYGLSLFDQNLKSYRPNISNDYFPTQPILTPNSSASLQAHWTEFMIGVKVETLKNLFVGASVSYKVMVNVKEPTNFKALYAPGFNRIFESGTGFGFNYTISYLIPFSKK